MTQTARDIDSLETLRILYPVFKEEVYRRRAAIAQIARQGSLFFVSLSLLTALFFSEGRTLSLLFKGLACAAVSFATILLIIQIRQEKLRHEKAKQQLITLEKGFQFFEAGSYLPNEPLYPPEWQKRPRIDPGMMISLAGLIGTSLLLILTILII